MTRTTLAELAWKQCGDMGVKDGTLALSTNVHQIR